MNSSAAPSERTPRRELPWWKRFGGTWIDRIIAVGVIGGMGVLMGTQYAEPNKRVIAVVVAALVFGIAWRIDMVAGIGLMVLALPYPRGTVFGNSNFALILLLLVIWLLRFTQRHAPPPQRTPVDMAIIGLFISYVVSFYSIGDATALNLGFQNFLVFASCVLMFYLIVNNVRTTRDLIRLHAFQAVSIATVLLLAVYELNNPGGAFIPGWIEFRGTVGEAFDTRNVRVGGPFFNYELLSEYCALSVLFVGFLFIRAKGLLPRVALGGLMVLTIFILFATVTRGSFLALGIGLIYMGWLMRRRLQIVPLTILISGVVAAFLAMNFYVANFTRSGNVVDRFSQTEFTGLVPDTRVSAWSDGWERFMQSPIIGHGPYYATFDGLRAWFWPHNLFLYVACLVGLVGLSFFVWMLFKLWMRSRPKVDSLTHPSYAQAFLLIAHVQYAVFLVDQMKIEYLRNTTYQFQIWVMFAGIIAASRIVEAEEAESHPPDH